MSKYLMTTCCNKKSLLNLSVVAFRVFRTTMRISQGCRCVVLFSRWLRGEEGGWSWRMGGWWKGVVFCVWVFVLFCCVLFFFFYQSFCAFALFLYLCVWVLLFFGWLVCWSSWSGWVFCCCFFACLHVYFHVFLLTVTIFVMLEKRVHFFNRCLLIRSIIRDVF